MRRFGCTRLAAAYVLSCTCLVTHGNQALGAALTSESSVSLASEYNSNPYLLPSSAKAAEAVAVMATLPATYTSDAQSFEIVPSARLAETRGDTELLTNYQYLNADWHLSSDRNTYSAGAEWHRDSTYYNVFENAELRGRTLPRTEESANAAWSRLLNERSSLQLSALFDQVNYSARSNFRLDNYDYAQGTLQYDWSVTERWTSSTSAGFGRYQLREQNSSNENGFVQTSLTRALSERWSAMVQVGYSRVNSSSELVLCCALIPVSGGYELAYIPVKESSHGGNLDYAVSVDRKSDRWSVNVSASRSLQPSSLGALLTQESAGAHFSWDWNERWHLGAGLNTSQQSDSIQHSDGLANVRLYSLETDLTWQWTEHWTLTAQTAYTRERVVDQSSGVAVTLTLARQLGRIKL